MNQNNFDPVGYQNLINADFARQVAANNIITSYGAAKENAESAVEALKFSAQLLDEAYHQRTIFLVWAVSLLYHSKSWKSRYDTDREEIVDGFHFGFELNGQNASVYLKEQYWDICIAHEIPISIADSSGIESIYEIADLVFAALKSRQFS